MLRKIKRDGSVRLDVDLGGTYCWIRTALVLLGLISIERGKKGINQRSHKQVCLFIIIILFSLKRNLVFILFEQKQMESDVGGGDNVHRGALLL